jgi:alpha-beta hydrolase superfamily lysophospholipase
VSGDGFDVQGARGRIAVRRWPNPAARYVALLAHGYGEHIGRYDHVAARLAEHGAAVYGPDHVGHGRSDGERVLVEDFDTVVADLHAVAERAREEHAGLPVVLIGHSMGGLIAARYAQLHGDGLAALVLSGPAIGRNPDVEGLLELDPIPDVPIDPAVLSRDPDVGARYAADELVWHGPFKRPTLEAMFAAAGAIAEGPALDGLPVLWIHGEADALVPLVHTRPAVEQFGGDRLEEHIYPEARHEVFNELNADEVLADVTAFVDRALASR